MNMKKVTMIKFKPVRILLMLIVTLLIPNNSCKEVDYKPFYNDDELLITSYFREKDQFSELYNILEYTDLANTFDVYGTYTFFAPDNNAFEKFYEEHGKNTYTDFSKEELSNLIRYHVLASTVETKNFGDGTLPDTTLSGDWLAVHFLPEGGEIMVNKEAKIITKDIVLPNGVIQVIDQVMTPVDYSVSKWVENNSDKYSIMAEALNETGIGNFLDSIYRYTSNGNKYHTWYTIFAIPDEILAKDGINSFEDLVKEYSPDDDNYTDKYNGVYRWLGYHVLTRSYSLTNFTVEPSHYGTLSNQVVQVEIDKEAGMIKLNRVVDTLGVETFTAIDEVASNNTAKNGLIHVLASRLEPVNFKPVKRRFYFADYPGIPYKELVDANKKGVLSNFPLDANGNVISLKPEMVDGIDFRYDGVVYIDGHGVKNKRIGWMYFRFNASGANLFTCTWDIPTLLPGDYNVIISFKDGGGRTVVQGFFDNKQFGPPVDMNGRGNYAATRNLGAIKISEAKPHKFKLKSVKGGYSLLGYVEFVPITNE